MPSLTSYCLPRASLAFLLLPIVSASAYITYPYRGITCSGGSECTVTWVDDGLTPLLAAVGRSDFALYHGTNTLVQQIASGLDVSQARELTFVPNLNAGPNSDSYWIKLTSLSARNPNDTSQPYASFSGYFSLDGMSGNIASPVPSLTSPLPSSSPGPPSPSGTITNGVVSTTTLSKASPSESGTSLSSELSALSAISSAASGLSSSRVLTTTTSPGAVAASGTASSSASSGTNTGLNTTSSPSGASQSLGPNSLLASSFQLGVALVLVVLTTTCVFTNVRLL